MEKLKEPKKPKQLEKPLPPEKTIEVNKELHLNSWDHDGITLAQILKLEGFKDIPIDEIFVHYVEGYHGEDPGYYKFTYVLTNTKL
jgi:hypothetical protein